jgi:hypothetical protein
MPPKVLQGWTRAPSKDPLRVPYRVAAECGLVLVLCSWSFTLLTWYRMRSPTCALPSVQSGVGRLPVAVVATRTGLAWSIAEDGIVRMAEREEDEHNAAPSSQAFHLEWAQTGEDGSRHFCLRCARVRASTARVPAIPLPVDATCCVHHSCGRAAGLRNMRLVEVARPGTPDAFMLKLSRRYACDEPTAFFALRGRSLYSLGVGGFVNYREEWHVRAHGDSGPPWTPLLYETAATMVALEPLPDRRDYVERSLLDLVRSLERNASCEAHPPSDRPVT